MRDARGRFISRELAEAGAKLARTSGQFRPKQQFKDKPIPWRKGVPKQLRHTNVRKQHAKHQEYFLKRDRIPIPPDYVEEGEKTIQEWWRTDSMIRCRTILSKIADKYGQKVATRVRIGTGKEWVSTSFLTPAECSMYIQKGEYIRRKLEGNNIYGEQYWFEISIIRWK